MCIHYINLPSVQLTYKSSLDDRPTIPYKTLNFTFFLCQKNIKWRLQKGYESSLTLTKLFSTFTKKRKNWIYISSKPAFQSAAEQRTRSMHFIILLCGLNYLPLPGSPPCIRSPVSYRILPFPVGVWQGEMHVGPASQMMQISCWLEKDAYSCYTIPYVFSVFHQIPVHFAFFSWFPNEEPVLLIQ